MFPAFLIQLVICLIIVGLLPPKETRPFFSSLTQHWATPPVLFDRLNTEFHFDCDPCPLGSTANGLAMAWTGKRVYCNPPYGPGIAEWLHAGRDAELAVFLLPARTDTKWFHDIVLPCASEIRFIRGRVRFRPNDPNRKPGGGDAPFPSMVVVFKGPPSSDRRSLPQSANAGEQQPVGAAEGSANI
jgi:hypothetical protein